MTPHSPSTMSRENNLSLSNETMQPNVGFSGERIKMRSFAHKKFMAAINRANDDDDKQLGFTSSAANLGTAGWLLTDLALRVAELSVKKVA